MVVDWHPQAYQALLAEDYHQAAEVYEQLIQEQPDVPSHYWYLGLAYLLQNREEEAQGIWLTPILAAEEEQIAEWTIQLQQILGTEAKRQEALARLHQSWLIRGHLREILPSDLENLLHFLRLSFQVDAFNTQLLQEWNVIELLNSGEFHTVDTTLLSGVMQTILNYLVNGQGVAANALAFSRACFHCATQPLLLIPILSQAASQAFYVQKQKQLAIDLAKLGLEIDSGNLQLLRSLYYFHAFDGEFATALEYGKQYYHQSKSIAQEITGNHLLLQALLVIGGRWPEATTIFERQKALILELTPSDVESFTILTAPSMFSYLQDNLQANRQLQNRVARMCQSNFPIPQSLFSKSRNNSDTSRRLKVAYISNHFRQHSIGWLCRWLFQYYNRDNFHLSLYILEQPINDFTQQWFVNQVDLICHFNTFNPEIVAQKIAEDEIDILVDLESVTHPGICQVMALKPAPVQVTWLGADASGLPAIDYFIADPYVLPNDAQNYYQEKIWRLPSTYIAVDGFEVDTSTLRREDLGIPSDAIIYFSAQVGHKRHPETTRLQMQILQTVPNSYFLIKGYADDESIRAFFVEIADQAGVSSDRLKFLRPDLTEYIHRANLQIADVVLDTYPYNGATTSLEVLWMEIPLVTRAGQEFMARNSYAFLTNAGISEGIAWTSEEYVEWGIKFGTDHQLRQRVAWKLKQSKHTSPLWNAKQFTREMEKAYQQMWAKYLESSSI